MTPDEIQTALWRIADPNDSYAEVSIDEAIWALIEDVKNSYTLAMNGAGIGVATIEHVDDTVSDYLANNYGED